MPSKAKNAVLVGKRGSLANLAGADGASGADSVAAHVSFDSLNVLTVAGALSSALIKSAYRLLLLVGVGVQGQSINRG